MRDLLPYADFGLLSLIPLLSIGVLFYWRRKLGKWFNPAAIAVLLLFFAYHMLFLTFEIDDAFISFRYVKNFLNGNGLVFNTGERVEGYTNFLWIILLSLAGKAGLGCVFFSRIIGCFFALGSVILLYFISVKLFDRDEFSALLPPLLLATNGSFAAWGQSGMETPMFAFILLLTYYAVIDRRHFWAGLLFPLLAMTRPEGALFAVICFIYILFSHTDKRLRAAVTFAIPAVILSVFYLLWKSSYYGGMLPNTFYAKQGTLTLNLVDGLLYVGKFFLYFNFTTLLFGIGVFAAGRMSREMKLILVSLLLYLLYVVSVGGDWMLGFRFITPIVPFIALIAFYGLKIVLNNLKNSIVKTHAADVIIMIFLFVAYSQTLNSLLLNDFKAYSIEYQKAINESRITARWFKENVPNDILLAASTIGALGYYSDLKILDIFGIVDPVIAHSPNKISGLAGHHSYDFDYVFSRKPEMMYFSYGRLDRIPYFDPVEKTPLGMKSGVFLQYYEPQSYLVTPPGKPPGYINVWKLKGFNLGDKVENVYLENFPDFLSNE